MMWTALYMLLSIAGLLGTPDTARLVFAGDAMQHRSQLDAARRPDGTYDYSACFEAVTPYVAGADLAVVNLETPLGGPPYSGYPMFCAPDSYLDALTDAGFDFVLASNNHALDRRDRGVLRTIDRLEERGVPYAGIWRDKAHRRSQGPAIVDVNGFRIAILNYTYCTNGIEIQGDILVDPIDTALIASDILRARELGAEVVAACMHWGVEYDLLPSRSQKRLADWLVSRGVDMVIGGHPHVIQPMEMRRDVEGMVGRNALVVYSLGNFISGMRTDDTRGGAMVEVTLRRDSAGVARVDSACYSMVYTVTPEASGQNFRLVNATDTIRTSAQNEARRRTFVQRARRVFDTHNKGVKQTDVAGASRGPEPAAGER